MTEGRERTLKAYELDDVKHDLEDLKKRVYERDERDQKRSDDQRKFVIGIITAIVMASLPYIATVLSQILNGAKLG